jgi:hypothetical protein
MAVKVSRNSKTGSIEFRPDGDTESEDIGRYLVQLVNAAHDKEKGSVVKPVNKVSKSGGGAWCAFCNGSIPFGVVRPPGHGPGVCDGAGSGAAVKAGQVHTVGSVAKARAERGAAIKALEDQAGQWERKVLDGAYSLQGDVKDYLVAKAKAARAEAARLRGDAAPEPAARPAAKDITITLPR